MTRPRIRRKLFHHDATRRTVQRDVDDEMRFHLQTTHRGSRRARDARVTTPASWRSAEYGDIARRARRAGVDRPAARRKVRGCREWLASVGQDVKFAARSLRARPGFAATVLLTLALGIGANAAIFSVVDAVLLKPLPFAQPDRLVHLWETYQSNVDNRSEASYPDYLDWRARNRSFTDLGGLPRRRRSCSAADHPQIVSAPRKTTANFFDVLGVHAVVGRTFAAGEDAVGVPRRVRAQLRVLAAQVRRRSLASSVARSCSTAPRRRSSACCRRTFSSRARATSPIWAPIDRAATARGSSAAITGSTSSRASSDGRRAARPRRRTCRPSCATLAREYPPTNADAMDRSFRCAIELVGSVRPLVLLLYGAVAS